MKVEMLCSDVGEIMSTMSLTNQMSLYKNSDRAQVYADAEKCTNMQHQQGEYTTTFVNSS